VITNPRRRVSKPAATDRRTWLTAAEDSRLGNYQKTVSNILTLAVTYGKVD
jgi:hypothetical protein